MSNAEVSKILRIDSAHQLYNILGERSDEFKSFIPFIDRMELFLYGCPCDAEMHWDQAISEYKKVITMDLKNLKDKIGCTSIHFYLDDELIGEA